MSEEESKIIALGREAARQMRAQEPTPYAFEALAAMETARGASFGFDSTQGTLFTTAYRMHSLALRKEPR